MKTVQHQTIECVQISNAWLTLLVTQSVGPRVLSLQVEGGENIFAELPGLTLDTPGQSPFECYCNHQFLELETLGPITTIQP